MSYKLITVFAAYGGGDDRGLGQSVIGYSRTLSGATAIAKGQAFYGADGTTAAKKAIETSDGKVFVIQGSGPIDLDGHEAAKKEAERQAALSRISPEDRKTLGLH